MDNLRDSQLEHQVRSHRTTGSLGGATPASRWSDAIAAALVILLSLPHGRTTRHPQLNTELAR